MNKETAKTIYSNAWANWNLTTDIEERRELENLMDSMQEKIASRPGPEWEIWKMKIIFLDIDGVLATWESLTLPWKEWQKLDQKAVEALNFITNETSAKIVISSTWRIGPEQMFVSMVEHLKNEGIEGDIIGRTPMSNRLRGIEIQQWLDGSGKDIESFVILDDDNDMCHLMDHLVWIENGLEEGGLTMEYAKHAIKLLKENDWLENKTVISV